MNGYGMSLRKEILWHDGKHGALELYDPLLQVVHVLTAEERAELEQGEEGWSERLRAKLDNNILLEGFGAQIIRNQLWENRIMVRQNASPESFPEEDWSIAEQLPDVVQPQWRRAEVWRRLFESARAGNDIFVLDDLIERDALLAQVDQIQDFSPYKSSVVEAHRAVLQKGLVVELMSHPVYIRLCQSILAVPLSEHTWIQAWKLQKGEGFGLHADGTKYLGTLSIGCCEDWKASNGGAIAFGENIEGFWKSRFCWLPHFGSALLFRPRADLWHVVENVVLGTRYSITGWWVERGHINHHHK